MVGKARIRIDGLVMRMTPHLNGRTALTPIDVATVFHATLATLAVGRKLVFGPDRHTKTGPVPPDENKEPSESAGTVVSFDDGRKWRVERVGNVNILSPYI
jgi:hypothetical protein